MRVHAAVNRKLHAELEQAAGLSGSAYDVMIQPARAPGRRKRMFELADAIVFSPSGLTRLVERLEREGLVARIKSADDGPGAYATLTPRGRQRLRRATVNHLEGIRRHFVSRLSREEQQQLADTWERVLATAPDDESGERANRSGS
jgi:DNA-binding MarR family transcriptional regulator